VAAARRRPPLDDRARIAELIQRGCCSPAAPSSRARAGTGTEPAGTHEGAVSAGSKSLQHAAPADAHLGSGPAPWRAANVRARGPCDAASWNFAVPSTAKFHSAGPCGGLGGFPAPGAVNVHVQVPVPRRARGFAAPSAGERDTQPSGT